MTAGTVPDTPHRHSTWKWLLAIAILAFMLTAGALIATDPGDNIVLEESAVGADAAGQRLITGTLRNRTASRTYSMVRVEVELLGPGGSVVGTTAAATSDLEPGESWTFTIPVPQPVTEVARFRLARLRCESEGASHPRMCSIGAPVVVD